ncbi:MAG: ACT domain-containing protein, partial [Clostridia bacterium]|nr:ACT domain-containing protein [Clostridia bacterium]
GDLTNFSQLLKTDRPVTGLFQTAKEYRDEIEGGLKNEQGYELRMDVEDKPGVIGQVAALLGTENINITNINISNSREFEGGVLRVRVKYQEDVTRAVTLLSRQGYQVKTH